VSSPDARLTAIAASQFGRFTIRQATEAGFTEAKVRRRRGVGLWIDIHPGVLAVAGSPPGWEADLWAAQLARHGSFVSHASAAQVHGMSFVEPPRRPSISGGRNHHPLPGVDVWRRRDIERCGLVVARGLRITDRPTTLVDLASVTRPRRYERIVDDQLSSHRVSLPELIDRFDLMARRGAAGIALARRVIAARAGDLIVAESELEARFREVIAPKLPIEPTDQFVPPWRTDGIGRVDVAFPTRRVLAELDGRRWHLRDEQWEADHRRDQEALEHRWVTPRYTFDQIRFRPASVVDNLTRILELGAGSAAG
jgi:hypothetical protein